MQNRGIISESEWEVFLAGGGYSCLAAATGNVAAIVACLFTLGSEMARDLTWFIWKVRHEGAYDYKYKDEAGVLQVEDFGNFHFGIIATAMGLPQWFAKCGAGIVHTGRNLGPQSGTCGDDPNDQRWIDHGYWWYQTCWQDRGLRLTIESGQ